MLLTVVYDRGMDERVMQLLEDRGIEGWTKTFDAHGMGNTGRKVDTPIWPGALHVLSIVLPQEAAIQLAESLRVIQRSYRKNPGLTMWMHPVRLL